MGTQQMLHALEAIELGAQIRIGLQCGFDRRHLLVVEFAVEEGRQLNIGSGLRHAFSRHPLA